MFSRVAYFAAPLFACALFALYSVGASGQAPQAKPSNADQLATYRNLGKAFYENPTTQNEAVAEFKKALDLDPSSVREQLNYALALLRAAKGPEAEVLLLKVQNEDPSLPHTWFNLGIYYKRAGDFDKALEQFLGMAKLVPDEPITRYNLGTIYKLQGKPDLAKKEFELSRNLNPSLAAPHFQLFNIYRQEGHMPEAQAELKLFNERKKAQEGDAIPKEDVEWCEYAEIYDPTAPEKDNTKQPVAFAFDQQKVASGAKNGGLVALDAFGTSHADLLVYSEAGITLLKGGTQKVSPSGLEGVTGVKGVYAGDFNNDGLADLCVLTDKGAQLFENQKGRFAPSKFTLPAGAYNAALWIDFDHDYDLDLMLLGKKSVLMRNQSEAGFAEHPFAFAEGEALSAVAFRVIADTKSKDFAVSYAGHPGVLYLDQLTAEYKSQPLPEIPTGATNLITADLDNDGNLDLAFTDSAKFKGTRNARGKFEPAVEIANGPTALADFASRGFTDAAASGSVRQNVGSFQFIAPGSTSGLAADAAYATSADFNNDGWPDLAAITASGDVVLSTNATKMANKWLSVQIDGVKNLKLPVGAEVEIKAGASYQKKVYTLLPLLFGLDSRSSINTVRITWPNGLIQNEMNQKPGSLLDFKEAQRLSGSCPLIFVWNGKEFQYVTDVLGVAPLGAMSGDGQYFPTDHTEYIPLKGEWLKPRMDDQGRSAYEVHLTEELSEVSYFDQIQLVAIDHPAGTEIYSNEKWKSPPFPDFRLYGLKQRIYPIAARSENADVLDRVLHQDKHYVDNFKHNYIGVAETHTLDLDFGKSAAPDNHAFLVLNGWVDWADGSTFLQQAQARNDLNPPSLQVKDKAGKWVTVIPDMGMPSGKPKTIAVDLTGKFLSDSREVRIVTNMCVYWDEVYLGDEASSPQVKLASLTPAESDVHFRGFSPSHIHPERKQPEYFDYLQATATSYWNPTPGNYTRYGDTTELTRSIDDRMVIMGSGDMLTLRFNDRQLPPLKLGWTRDYLLRVEGWAKDRDANTAFSQSVLPLPFHAMSRYPYPANEHYPDDQLHRDYVKKYLTRPALVLIRPLAPEADARVIPH